MPAKGLSRRASVETSVEVRCTGQIRDAVGSHELEFAFDGERLRSFLEAFVTEYALEDLLVADPGTVSDPTVRIWARPPGDVPGWDVPDDGDEARPYGRICINGRFSDRLAGLETRLEDGDRIALLYPFLFAP